ncbi:MAG TPA: TIGR03118 family protein [Puia sp.]|jgi:uncharacterized protein (TIGR03118 family)|nr:TIGR03118 family protein [Puia sp.]
MNKLTLFHLRMALRLMMGGLLVASCHKGNFNQNDLKNFEEVVLVANKAMYGPKLVDTTLQNAWGLAWAPSGIAWVNANGAGLSELYTGEGAIVRPPVNIPSSTDSVGGVPSGNAYVGGSGFTLADGQGALFVFVSEDGVLSGWNGADGNNAQLIRNRSANAVYKGVALDSVGGRNYIYAANFMTGKVDVFDNTFNLVSFPFHDPHLPAGYAPFNIKPIGNWLFVVYAEQTPGSIDEMHGAGLGIVDVFTPDGTFVRRFASHGSLNAPWGIAWAPAGWLSMEDMSASDEKGVPPSSSGGDGKHDVSTPVVLIGNFGDGHINVYAPDGSFLGQLRAHNRTIAIDGLWALSFPPSTATSIDPNRLYFTAGPADEADGIFGYLIKQ